MPTSLYNFQYVPLTGRLPGKSFVSQTEQAINGLAQYVYDNSTNYEAVKAIAQRAEEDSSSALEYSEEALDKAQTALETVGRAYIKTTSAVDLDDYYDSELLLILSTESTNLPANISGYLTVMSADTHDYCMQVYIGIDGSVYKRTATISDNTPTFGAWSETPITMSVLQPLLNALANVDASNIGINADTDNSIAWGNAIGGGEIASGEQRLITGGTVYPLSVDVDVADKRISNIEKLLQGNLYDYQTDNSSAYTKSVPSGAMPYAGLEQIGGKTIVWNQLVDSGTTTVPTISGHMYYTLIDGTASIVTSDGTAISVVDDTADMVCDLTLMFGSGNEPSTTAEFTAIYPATHYPYNAGQLLSAGVTTIFSEGQNLINPANFTTSGVSFADGVITINTSSGRNYRDIYTGTEYTATAVPLASIPKMPFLMPGTYTFAMDSRTGNEFRLTVYAVAENGSVTQIGYISGGSLLVTLTFDKPTRITLRSRYSSTITNLRLTKTSSAVPYKPYFSATYPIHAEVQALEGYGWSAGTAYNYVDFERKVFVQNVARVDISSLNSWDWTSSSIGRRYYIDGYDLKQEINIYSPHNDSVCANIVCSRYATTPYESPSDMSISYGFSDGVGDYRIAIYDDTYNSLADWKTAMNGVYLYYELAIPQEIDISEYLTDDNLISVEAGGTLTFPNQNGDDYLLPVPSEEIYMIDIQSALGE